MNISGCVQVFGPQIMPAGRVAAFIDLKCGRCESSICQLNITRVSLELQDCFRGFARFILGSERVSRASAKRVYREYAARLICVLEDIALHARDACDAVKNAFKKILRDLGRVDVVVIGATPNTYQRQWIGNFVETVRRLALCYLNANQLHLTLSLLGLPVIERVEPKVRHDGSVVWSLFSKTKWH